MTLRVQCTNGHRLSVKDDLEGKRVRCPKCKILFRAEAAEDDDDVDAEPVAPKAAARRVKTKKKPEDDLPIKRRASDDDDDDDDSSSSSSTSTPEERRKARQRDKKLRLRKVNIGLLMHIIKLWVLVVLVFFFFLKFVFDTNIAVSNLPSIEAEMKLSKEALDIFRPTTNFCGIVVLCLIVVTPVVGVAGSGFCCIAPKKSEAGGTIVTALVFDVIPLIASILLPMALFDVFGLDDAKKERLLTLLATGSVFFSIAALFLFLIFLRKLAYYIQKPLIAAEGLNLLSWLMIMTVSAPVALFAMGFLAPIIVGAIGCVLNVAAMFLMTLGWFGTFYYMFFQGFLRLLNAERETIGEIT